MFATVPVSTTCCRAYYRVLRAHRGVVRHRRIHTRGIDDAHEQPRHATITPHPLVTFRVMRSLHLRARSRCRRPPSRPCRTR
jgi:hypothetical protein